MLLPDGGSCLRSDVLKKDYINLLQKIAALQYDCDGEIQAERIVRENSLFPVCCENLLLEDADTNRRQRIHLSAAFPCIFQEPVFSSEQPAEEVETVSDRARNPENDCPDFFDDTVWGKYHRRREEEAGQRKEQTNRKEPEIEVWDFRPR